MAEHNKDTNNEKLYWKSIEEFQNDGVLDPSHYNEFRPGVKDDFDPSSSLNGISRRKFLTLLSASAALAAAGCTDYRDKGKLMPYNSKPEEITIGVPNHYASTCTGCENQCGILIKTREGRPIKVDGNPEHPISKGKICEKGQGSIMDLYDPSRIKSPLFNRNGIYNEISWVEADKQITKALSELNGNTAAIISHRVFSPVALRLHSDFADRYPGVKFYYYDLFEGQTRVNAWKKCYGENSTPAIIKWEAADVWVSLEADLFGSEGNPVEQIRAHANRKDVKNAQKMNKLYAVEGRMTTTGMNSDYRIKLNTAKQYDFLMSMISDLSKQGVTSDLFNSVDFSAYDSSKLFESGSKDAKAFKQLVKDLASNRGKSIIYAGETSSEQVHILVNLLNEALGNSSLYDTKTENLLSSGSASKNDWESLINDMKSGKVKVLINYDSNPAYHLTADYGFEDALKNVGLVVSLTALENESSFRSNYILPVNHTFESWGDAQTRSGVKSLIQPVIEPLYNTRQKESIILNWMQDDVTKFDSVAYHDYLKNYWLSFYFAGGANPDKWWFAALHDGVIVDTGAPDIKYTFSKDSGKEVKNSAVNFDGFTLLLTHSPTLHDGRFANNGFLQELPNSVSKITWDNYLSVSYNSAKALGIKTGSLVELDVDGRKLNVPVLIQPGMEDKTVSIDLGYGRTKSPVVAQGVGFNTISLMSKEAKISPFIYQNVKIKQIPGKYELASSQDHYNYDETLIRDAHLKRHIIKEGTVAGFIENPNFLHEKPKHSQISMYPIFEYKDVKWGMNIDLNKCVGCGQCVVACNVENNIPVVGKDQVATGREMHWLRIDRYYSGTPDEPVTAVQPMMCQHCDKAPCENVCPVVATTHSPDGLNQMVYNRCVGTRYCSNNCPYKVRRFNFYDFRDHFAKGYYYQEPVNYAHNPEVTVRSRGVMEKCTFCVHRIEQARSQAKVQGRMVSGADVKTACQDACPANAISFGDQNNKESEFAKDHEHNLAYFLLEEINVKPNIAYLAKLRNTQPEGA